MSKQIIEVPLPEGIKAQDVDLDLLNAIFRAIVTLRFEEFPERENVQGQIEKDGWDVNWGLTWVAEAKRGQTFEFAIGKTTEEALKKLYHNTQLARQECCP